MRTATKWAVRNLLLLLLAVVPALGVMLAVSVTIAGYDPTAAAPARVLGDLGYLYPGLALLFAVGGLVQSVLTLVITRIARVHRRLVAVTLAPLAFVPLALSKLLNLGALYQAVPLVIALALYAALIGTPPSSAEEIEGHITG